MHSTVCILPVQILLITMFFYASADTSKLLVNLLCTIHRLAMNIHYGILRSEERRVGKECSW